MTVSIIVAAAENGVIGRDNALPWRLSADLQRFKRLTMGHAVVMGRKTYESIGRPLPGRRMMVVTRQADYAAPGIESFGSLEEAIAAAMESGDQEVFVIGGAAVFERAAPLAERLYFTRVHADLAGDVSFPPIDKRAWRLVESQRHAADAKNEYPYSFETYERTPPSHTERR